jgi:hypothetical protein
MAAVRNNAAATAAKAAPVTLLDVVMADSPRLWG